MNLIEQNFDIVLVGGGLANSLIALATLCRSPNKKLLVIESANSLGGNHTWSFHTADVSAGARFYVDALVEHRWAGYTVEFPKLSRRVESEYASFTSARLHEVVSAALARSPGSRLLLGRRAVEVLAERVVLDDGSVVRADLVVDGRGPQHWHPAADCRFQKFVGWEVSLRSPAPVREPLLMDARVSQSEGFRFMYVLPFTPQRVLLEDTYFSDSPKLDSGVLERRIVDYAERSGFVIDSVLRKEVGVLPLPLRMPADHAHAGPLVAGYAGGWFHPTTGYSFPAAIELAEFVASTPTGPGFYADLAQLVSERARQQRYFCLLNRLLYRGFPPHERFNVLSRFYQLPTATIGRFYAMQTTTTDRARIICGRPPRGLSISHALTPSSPS